MELGARYLPAPRPPPRPPGEKEVRKKEGKRVRGKAKGKTDRAKFYAQFKLPFFDRILDNDSLRLNFFPASSPSLLVGHHPGKPLISVSGAQF